MIDGDVDGHGDQDNDGGVGTEDSEEEGNAGDAEEDAHEVEHDGSQLKQNKDFI